MELFPPKLLDTMVRLGASPTRYLLTVEVATQRMILWEQSSDGATTPYEFKRDYVISTSAWGIGQVKDSQQTPLGLHRIAQKIGGDCPEGTIFKARVPVGRLGDGVTEGTIVHRILWLEGLEPGWNRGGNVDTFERYIYIHGFNDETTLGRPASHGCVHVAAADLLPLYDLVPVGTLVWIAERL